MDTHRFPTGMGNDMRESPILFSAPMVRAAGEVRN